jgi:hypothetical protein
VKSFLQHGNAPESLLMLKLSKDSRRTSPHNGSLALLNREPSYGVILITVP